MKKLIAIFATLFIICVAAFGVYEVYCLGYRNGTLNALDHVNGIMAATRISGIGTMELEGFIDGITVFWKNFKFWG